VPKFLWLPSEDLRKNARHYERQNEMRGTPKDYPSISSDKPLGVEEMVRKLLNEPVFAGFFRHKLFLAHQNDQAAIRSVESYYKGLTPEELEEFGLSEKDTADCRKTCTDNTRFVIGAAFYGWMRQRKKKR
jgi:hypothetical protein